MAEPADSWEDMEPDSQVKSGTTDPQSTKPRFNFNPNAPSFTFNPSAPSFTPAPGPTSFGGYSVAVAPVVSSTTAESASHVPAQTAADPSSTAGVPIHAAVTPPDSGSGDAALPALSDLHIAGVNSEAKKGLVDNPPSGSSLAGEVEQNNIANETGTVVARESPHEAPTVNGDQSSDVEEEGVDSNDKEKEKESEKESQDAEETDSRQHLNVVFIGHVDAGKSTIGGQILYLSNMVDERTIQKYEKEAKEKNRESWYMAYIMDTNEEERLKGKTVEVGRAHFETEKTRFTILDAPGHKNYVPNMISGASQADVGVLVIAARKGEFETGFERGGQTREHAQLAKTLGVTKLFVVVNKMDDPSVEWSKERFDEIEKKLIPFLKSCGYNVKKDVQFLPISGLLGVNMKERLSKDVCPWWDGPCLFEALDTVELPDRDPSGPFRMPLIDKFKDMGTVVMGKIESGSVRRGDSLMVMPNKALVKVVTVYRDNDDVDYAKPGENLRVRLSGVEEEDILSGFVLSSIVKPVPAVTEFDAQLQILELLDHKAIFTAGYKAILHIHSVVEECEIIDLLHQIEVKTKKPMKKKTLFVKSGAVVVVRIQVNDLICVEKYEDFPQLGRFTLRDEGKTVAIGKIVNLPTVTGTQE